MRTSRNMEPGSRQAIDRYLAVVERARKRYSRGSVLLITEAGGKPSVYSRIEAAAWSRYMLGQARPDPKTYPLPPGAFAWWDNPCPRRGF